MKPCSYFLPLLSCFCLTFGTFAQNTQPKFAKASHWVEPIDYRPDAVPDEEQRSGVYYLLYDEQENTLTQEDYYRSVYKILSTEGLQEMADLRLDFDPSYQELIFHECKIIRNGYRSITKGHESYTA